MSTRIDAYGISDIGNRRSENQDQFLVGKLHEGMSVQIGSIAEDRIVRLPSVEGTFLIVADGMGGRGRGIVASAVSVECFARYLHWRASDFLVPRKELPERLVAAVRFCHRTICKISQQRPDLRGMGTTLTAAYVLGRKLYVVHAGDSRCYLLRRSRISQLTTDHTLAQLYRDADGADASNVAEAKLRHVLWNCIGAAESDLEVEVVECDVRHGDRLVLCSDGLSNYVDKRSITAIVLESTSVETACRSLVTAANEAGGSDNITVVVGQCVSGRHAESGRQTHSRRDVASSSEDTHASVLHDNANGRTSCKTPVACSR